MTTMSKFYYQVVAYNKNGRPDHEVGKLCKTEEEAQKIANSFKDNITDFVYNVKQIEA